ncbi:Uncharacterised protein [Mycobacteroides abscessus subsp. abscessus]|nr:Uncharacterised protein [Mycobacteroides abscessus subsp. abscessus]
MTPAARFVTREMPSRRAPSDRAAMASRTVDMPTRSAPTVRSIRISAGVSYCGPVRPAYTPSVSSGSSSRARARNPGSQASTRSTKVAPASGERPVSR